MYSEDEEDDPKPERLPIYRKGKEIFDMVNKIADLIPENNEYLMEVKSQMLCDAAFLSVKVAGAEAGGLYEGEVHSIRTRMMIYHSGVRRIRENNKKTKKN